MDKNSACAIKTKTKMAVALKELMGEMPFEKITVSDITEQCRIHRQTFYYHFQDRYELLNWIVTSELLEPFAKDFSFDNMYERFEQVFSKMAAEKKFYQNAIKSNSIDFAGYISKVSEDYIRELLHNVSKAAKVSPLSEEDNRLSAEFFGFGLAGVISSWANRGMKESPQAMTRQIANIIDICKQITEKRNMLA